MPDIYEALLKNKAFDKEHLVKHSEVLIKKVKEIAAAKNQNDTESQENQRKIDQILEEEIDKIKKIKEKFD